MRISCKSDIGRVRAANEDAWKHERITAVRAAVDLVIVADGMGGHRAGDVASKLAVNEFAQSLKTSLKNAVIDQGRLLAAGKQALVAANYRVFSHALENPDCRGMGTTLTAVLCYNAEMVIVHVGDSRAYLMRGGRIAQLTRDHSLVGEMVEQGKLTERQAMTHPQSNILTNALGLSEEVHGDIFAHDLKPGDTVVLCSDGLSTLVESREVAEIISAKQTPSQVAERLVELANDRGGVDNITVAVLFND